MHLAKLSLAARRRLDRVCDSFESDWSAGKRPDIRQYVEELEEPERSVALCELIILDMSYRWQSGAAETKPIGQIASVRSETPGASKDHLPDQPRLDDYMALFPELAPIGELPVEVIQEEFRVLNQWGDGPTVASYLDRFPKRRDLAEALEEVLAALSVEFTKTNGTTESGKRPKTSYAYPAGRFRVLRHHATGGLGRVSIASDSELNREVALKEIQERFAGDRACQARFVMEAEVTARLEHPGVVPVYGFGRRDNGRPYYAMRFIRGTSLRDAIDQCHAGSQLGILGDRSIELRKLLQRLINVCNTIEYAHSRGVIHRDIKPDNVMLGDYGETLVVDWGLAKLSAETVSKSSVSDLPLESHDLETAATQDGSVVGTPAYMSPEQAAGPQYTGPASDVYGLGATLYHLLTGRPPCENTNVRTLLDNAQAGEYTSPREICPEIPKALEAICQKAMRSEPSDRYASPRDMAGDLDRWLADQPVSAYREPLSARAKRWGKRHRTFVTTGLVASVLIAVSLAVVLAVVANRHQMLIGKNTELARANETSQLERTAAEKAREQTRITLQFLTDAFRSADPSVDGRKVTIAESLDRARKRITEEFDDQPLMKAELLHAIGQTYDGLGLPAEAVESLEQAEDLRRSHLGQQHRDTLVSMSVLAMAYHAAGDARALPLAREVHALRARILGADHVDTLRSHRNLAAVLLDAGDLQQAVTMLEELREKEQSVLERNHLAHLDTMNNLAIAYQKTGMTKKALPLVEEAVQRRRSAYGDDDPRTLTSVINLAAVLRATGERQRAQELLEQALPRCQVSLGENHTRTLTATSQLASIHADRGNLQKARLLYEDAYQRSLAAFGEVHPDTLQRAGNLAYAYYLTNDVAKAVDLQEQVLKEFRATKGNEHPLTTKMMSNLGASHLAAGDWERALPLFQLALELRRKKLGDDHPDTIVTMINLAATYHRAKEFEQAAPICDEAVSHLVKTLGEANPLTLVAMSLTAENLLERKEFVRAESLCRTCLEHRKRRIPESWLRYQSTSLLGAVLAGQDKFAEAEPLLVDGYKGLKAREASIHYPARYRVDEARQRIVHLYEALHLPEKADSYRRDLDRLEK